MRGNIIQISTIYMPESIGDLIQGLYIFGLGDDEQVYVWENEAWETFKE